MGPPLRPPQRGCELGEGKEDRPFRLQCVLMDAGWDTVGWGQWGASWVVPSLLLSRGMGEEEIADQGALWPEGALWPKGARWHCAQGRAKSPVTLQHKALREGALETRMKGLLETDFMRVPGPSGTFLCPGLPVHWQIESSSHSVLSRQMDRWMVTGRPYGALPCVRHNYSL